MKIELSFAQLHNGLFLSGKNHKEKLYAKNAPAGCAPVAMIYDTEVDQLFAFYNKEIAIIPSSNISSMTPVEPGKYADLFKNYNPGKPQKTHVSHPMVLNPAGAQVSDPTTQVQNPVIKKIQGQ